jgi:hypothetical protein
MSGPKPEAMMVDNHPLFTLPREKPDESDSDSVSSVSDDETSSDEDSSGTENDELGKELHTKRKSTRQPSSNKRDKKGTKKATSKATRAKVVKKKATRTRKRPVKSAEPLSTDNEDGPAPQRLKRRRIVHSDDDSDRATASGSHSIPVPQLSLQDTIEIDPLWLMSEDEVEVTDEKQAMTWKTAQKAFAAVPHNLLDTNDEYLMKRWHAARRLYPPVPAETEKKKVVKKVRIASQEEGALVIAFWYQ